MLKAKVLIFLTAGVLSMPFFVALKGQISPNQANLATDKQQIDLHKKFKSTFPVVEYSYDRISDPYRKAKSQKYGRIPVLNPDKLGNDEEFASTHWESGLSALPVDKSQIIVVGKVVKASAFLSENKVSVYSEFKIKIEKVFKDDFAEGLKPDNYVFAEREGGIVRFPSGFEKWFYIAGQRMPTIQNRYLFFLSRNFPGLDSQERDLHILTAYELIDGTVVPLDYPGGGTHPIARAYKGKDSLILFDDLTDKLAKSGKPKNEEN